MFHKEGQKNNIAHFFYRFSNHSGFSILCEYRMAALGTSDCCPDNFGVDFAVLPQPNKKNAKEFR